MRRSGRIASLSPMKGLAARYVRDRGSLEKKGSLRIVGPTSKDVRVEGKNNKKSDGIPNAACFRARDVNLGNADVSGLEFFKAHEREHSLE